MIDSDFRERLLDRAGRAVIALTPTQLEQIQLYCELLSHWNERINLTSFRLNPFTDETIDRLLVEPLFASRLLEDLPYQWFDLGSGGGTPAVPLKIVRPRVRLTLVESRSKKTAFLREVTRELRLSDVEVTTERFELLAETPEALHSAHLVTARAIRADADLLSSAHRLLVSGGRLLFFGTRGLALQSSPTFQLQDELDLCPDTGSRLFQLIAK